MPGRKEVWGCPLQCTFKNDEWGEILYHQFRGSIWLRMKGIAENISSYFCHSPLNYQMKVSCWHLL